MAMSMTGDSDKYEPSVHNNDGNNRISCGTNEQAPEYKEDMVWTACIISKLCMRSYKDYGCRKSGHVQLAHVSEKATARNYKRR